MPRVTFLLAVHNGASTIGEAVGSVLAQTFEDFEIVVVDDASTDGTAEVLRGFGDRRVKVLGLRENLGLAGALNSGMAEVRGEFVARMDADDVALPERAAVQVAYLEERAEVAVVGSFIQTFSAAGEGAVIRYPAEPGACTAALLFRSALAHPAVMWRRAALEKLRYEPAFRYAQDYALWLECVKSGLVLANVPEVLLRYRVHQGQLSAAMDRMQEEGTAIRSRFLRWFVEGVSAGELALHEGLSRDRMRADGEWVAAATRWLEKLAGVNEVRRVFEREPFLRALTGRYVALVRFARGVGVAVERTGVFAPYVEDGAI